MYDRQLFKETFSLVKASEGTLMEVLKMTTNRKRSIKALRIIPIAAVIAILCSITALATVGFMRYENPLVMLRAFFGEGGVPSSEGIVEYDEHGKLAVNLPGWERISLDETLAGELITNYIYAETISVSWGGYTLTVEANLYDPVTESGLLYYTIENPQGVKGYGVDVNGLFGWNNYVGNIKTYSDKSGETYFDEAMSTDTKVYICEYYINSNNTDDKAAISIYLCEQVADYEPIYEGAGTGVKSEIRETVLIRHDDSRDIPTLSLNDGSILISPISISIFEGILGFNTESYIHRIVLRYDDGSEYTLVDANDFVNNSMYALSQYGDGDDAKENTQDARSDGNPAEPGPMIIDAEAKAGYHTTYLFNRIVDIRSLSEIILDDLVVIVE